MRSGIRTLGIALGAVALLLCLAGSASAQTYTVTRNDDPNPAPCEPGNCSLRGALMASNGSTTVDDLVMLPASAAPYLLVYEFFPFQISDETEVRGAGANQTVVKGDGLETIFGIEAGVKATLSGMTITGGQAAIQNNGELLVRGVAIEGNKWKSGTAGIITNGPLTVESSFLGFNRTEAASGGVIHTNAPLTIANSTIAHNSSKEGPGAISANFGVAVTLVNTAVVSNRSEVAPMAAVGGSPLTLRNSVFADNRDAAGLFNCVSAGPVASLGGNVSDDATCGGSQTDKPNVNPGLGTLELHGGTTPVYSLLAGSPAIDATSDCPPVDQRGVARPQGAACDSGPYELQLQAISMSRGKVVMRLGKKNLKLSRSGFVRVRLACVSTEGSSPCRGKITLRGKFRFPSKKAGASARRYPSATFSIAAGKAKGVRIRIPRPTAESLIEKGKSKKVTVSARARDGAGNASTIEARRKIVPPKRG